MHAMPKGVFSGKDGNPCCRLEVVSDDNLRSDIVISVYRDHVIVQLLWITVYCSMMFGTTCGLHAYWNFISLITKSEICTALLMLYIQDTFSSLYPFQTREVEREKCTVLTTDMQQKQQRECLSFSSSSSRFFIALADSEKCFKWSLL